MTKKTTFKSPVTKKDYVGNLEPRYAGIPTFMRTPLAETLEDVDIGLIGVPYDGGVTNRAGARHGPREVRNQSSLMRTIHHINRESPFDIANIADLVMFHSRNLLIIKLSTMTSQISLVW